MAKKPQYIKSTLAIIILIATIACGGAHSKNTQQNITQITGTWVYKKDLEELTINITNDSKLSWNGVTGSFTSTGNSLIDLQTGRFLIEPIYTYNSTWIKIRMEGIAQIGPTNNNLPMTGTQIVLDHSPDITMSKDSVNFNIVFAKSTAPNANQNVQTKSDTEPAYCNEFKFFNITNKYN